MALAIYEAQRSRYKYIVAEHILIGLLKEQGGTGYKALKKMGVDIETMLLEVQKSIESGPGDIDMAEPPRPSVMEHAIEEAKKLGHKYVGTEHILLALLHYSEEITGKVFADHGLKYEDVRRY